jgi:hypothetical protein
MFSLMRLYFCGEIEYSGQQLSILIEMPENFTFKKW